MHLLRRVASIASAVFLIAAVASPAVVYAQASLPAGPPLGYVQQSFGGMGTSATAALPTGFKFSPSTTTPTWADASNTTACTQRGGTTAAASAGGAYNWSNGDPTTSTERAVGFLTSGSFASNRSILYALTNNTGATVTSLSVSWRYEKYRNGTAAGGYNWAFFYSTDGSTWTSVSAGDQAYAADANNNVVSPCQAIAKNVTITGLSLANSSNVYLRWYLTGGPSNSQGLAIDNLEVSTGRFIARDDATDSVYTAWDNGDNGGSGWGAGWVLTAGGGGFFRGDSTGNGTGGDSNLDLDINTPPSGAAPSQALGMYNSTGATTDAVRTFPFAMRVGDQFRLRFDNGNIASTKSAGWGLQNASGQNLVEFIFPGGGSNYSVIDNAGTTALSGLSFDREGIDCVLTLTSATTYSLRATKMVDGTSVTQTGTLSSPGGGQAIAQMRVYNFNSGSGSASDLFINSPGLVDPIAPTLTTVTIASNNANTAKAKVGDTVTLSITASETLSVAPTVTINGSSATVTGSGPYSASRTMLVGDTEGTITFSISGFQDQASNTGATVTSTTNSSSVVFDKTAPSLSPVSIASSNANTARAKVGDTVTVSFTASEALAATPTVTINGSSATVTGTGPYSASRTMLVGDTEGAVSFSISGLQDTTGNAGSAVSSTTNSSSVTFDKTAPTLSPVTIASNNANTALAKVGDTVTVSFTASEALAATPTVTINGSSATVTGTGPYSASRTMLVGDTEGAISFSISSFQDAAGNAGSAVSSTTNSSSVTFDKTAPTLSPVAIASNNANTALAKAGDIITLSFTSSEALTALPTVSIAGQSASVSNPGGNNYTATTTVTGATTEGSAAISISAFSDATGNGGSTVTATTNSSSVTVDRTAPTLSPVTIASNNANTALAKVGDTVTVSFTASEALAATPTVTINGSSATVTGTGPYSASRTMLVGDTEGAVSFSISGLQDTTGNAGSAVSSTTNASSVTFDKTAPTLSPVTIASNNANTALAKVGDTVTVSITASESLAAAPTVTINGSSATVTGTGPYSASRTMLVGDTEGAITFSISSFQDAAGNAGSAVSSTTDASSVNFDKTAPTLSPVAIASNNANTALAKAGDIITLSFTSSEALTALPTVSIAGQSASVSNPGGNNYTATTTVTGATTEGSAAISISAFSDATGNGGSTVTATTNSSSVTVDRTAPTLSPVAIASNNANTALAKVGDTVTVSFTASESLAATPTVTINGSSATVTGTGPYSASRTMLVGDTEGAVSFSISGLQDTTGNAGSAVSSTTNASSVTFDKTAPTTSASANVATKVTGAISGTYASNDGSGSGIQSVSLFARSQGGSWTNLGTISGGTWNSTPLSSGVWYFQTVGTDAAGNTEAAPSGSTGTGDATVVYNTASNGAVAQDVSGPGTFLFPMKDGLLVSITFASVTTGGTLSVSRFENNTMLHGAPISPAGLIGQRWNISNTGIAFTSATVVFAYEDTLLNGLNEATDLDTAFAVNPGPMTTTYISPSFAIDTILNTVTVSNVTGFSDWYIGRNNAVEQDWMVLDEQ